MTFPSSVLITGAGRGIGLGLVKEFLKNDQVKHVFAAVRCPTKADELTKLNDDRLHVIKMDVLYDESILEAFQKVEEICGEHGLNLLVNNAGIWVEYELSDGPKRDMLRKILDTNAASPLIVSQVFLPLLRRAASKSPETEWGIQKASIVNISSGMGSISENMTGSGCSKSIAYRMSKEINQMTRTLAIDLEPDGIMVVSWCPGWVKTDMGGLEAEITVDESAIDFMQTLSHFGKENTGGYVRRHGDSIDY
ncbi:unnamed protein product, partial [Mesorhabditis belari]|uniref:Uncharacterized protein n=1 Tax=Mesorhabditis belari TaxID=2138241 RepID=A0AAF3JBB2_9BILA